MALATATPEVKEAMKHLNVKWVPETVTFVSLKITSPWKAPGESIDLEMRHSSAAPHGKLIVISGRSELRARVTTAALAAAACSAT